MSEMLEKAVTAFLHLSKIPALTSGKLIKNGRHVTSSWSMRELDRWKTAKINYDYVLSDGLNLEYESLFGLDISNEILSSISPSGKLRAVIRELADAKNPKKQFLEVWNSKNLTKSIDLSALDLHGDVYADAEFGSFSWHKDETKILYIAEKKRAKSEPFIKRLSDKKCDNNDKGDEKVTKGEEYIYKEEWGEQLVGKHLSVIVSFDLKTEKCTVLKGLPESWCPGQVTWSGDDVVGVAWETEPRRLGLKFCTNRISYVFLLKPDSSFVKISDEGVAVTSPRVSPDGGVIFWLQRKTGGPHHAAHHLMSINIQTSVKSIITDIVETKKNIENGEFYGIFCQQLPRRCFAQDGKFIVFSTPQRLQIKSYAVEIGSGKMWDISYDKNKGSTTVLDVDGSLLLGTISSLQVPSQLVIGKLGDGGNISWHLIGEKPESPVPNSEVEYLNLEHTDSTESVRDFYAMYFGPKSEESSSKLPLILFIHGGPHSASVDSFALEYAFFVKLGFSILLINYRGSLGNGDGSVHLLPTGAGTIDVVDCKLAADEAIKRFPIDAKKVLLYGGSHGGFLVTHLSGQYPDAFAAVSTRNPVIDMASFYNSSDIPDWCAVEAGGVFTEQGPPSEELLLKMRRCSPMVHVHKVKAPTAIMLGSGDKRVPHYQGLEYYHRLKANGCKTKLFMYEDNHSLSSLPVEVDNVINSAIWFAQHTSF